jgi:hypothetical protein
MFWFLVPFYTDFGFLGTYQEFDNCKALTLHHMDRQGKYYIGCDFDQVGKYCIILPKKIFDLWSGILIFMISISDESKTDLR